MGKAYSEDEKKEIRQKIWEVGLEMFHDDNHKSLNIRELTERVGISLGSYYNFYKNKKSLIRDIMEYRMKQKLNAIRITFPDSRENPVQYVANLLYINFWDMGEKVQNKAIYKEMLDTVLTDEKDVMNQMSLSYEIFFGELTAYWEKENLTYEMDIQGVLSLIYGLFFFFGAKKYMEESYFEELLKEFIYSGMNRYLKCY
ncbi:MAG: TetR/AcrR family transcriptional regulator [Lachnospiraceae bacterium]|nr:TetR/AcrR family transcriptional regulator [Lachnospiraceae bacterium]